jgi:hypothetical protein
MNYLFVDGAYLQARMDDWGRRWFDEPTSFRRSGR